MQLKRNIFFIGLCFLSVFAFSQSSGYLGKKFVIGYGFNASPVTLGPRINKTVFQYNDTSGNKFTLGALHEGFIEYAITDRFQLASSVKYYRTTYANERLVKGLGRPESHYKISGLTYCLSAKYFSEPYVAPWGRYYLFGAALNTTRSTYDKYMYVKGEISGHDTLYNDFGPEIQKNSRLDILFGKGRTRIIADNVVIDYGFTAQVISAVSKVGILLGGVVGSTSALTKSSYIKQTTKQRVHDFNCFNVFIKVGYLF